MRKKISKTEKEIMDYILDISIITPQQLYQYFDELGNQLKISTIYAMLRKLQERNLIELRKEGRNNYYTPKISQKEFSDLCSSQTPGSIDVVPLFYCSLNDDLLSSEDIERLRKMINELPNE